MLIFVLTPLHVDATKLETQSSITLKDFLCSSHLEIFDNQHDGKTAKPYGEIPTLVFSIDNYSGICLSFGPKASIGKWLL